MERLINLKINGQTFEVKVRPYDSLNKVLRDYLGLTGTKRGCDYGGCGACTVIIDGKAVYSCMYPALKAEDKTVLTIEGLSSLSLGHLLQRVFVEMHAIQCGYCIPGFIMAAYALLINRPDANRNDVVEAITGNLCRCGTYQNIIKAVERVLIEVNRNEQSIC
jgi:carbon-monoxide dehydrogenase small subunit